MSLIRVDFARASMALLLLVACGACRSADTRSTSPEPPQDVAEPLPEGGPVPRSENAAGGAEWPTAPDFVDGDEWIRLKSGEWLKGEFVSLSRETVEFDSAELDDLALDWDDVAEVVTTRSFTVLRTDRSVAVGAVRVSGDQVFLRTDEGVTSFPRAELMRMIGATDGRANWSGSLRLAGAFRRGNTDQIDSILSVNATRRTASTRTNLYLDNVFSRVEGRLAADNQTFRGNHDVFVSPRFYVTPLGLELFRDPFQNLALRATPYTGLGYTLVDNPGLDWSANAGVGYRHARFDSVEPGEDTTRDTATMLLGTDYNMVVTSSVDLELTYKAQIGLEDTTDTNQEAGLKLTFDFVWDLDFDVRFLWKRVGVPETDQDGVTPLRDDYRLDVGVSWKF